MAAIYSSKNNGLSVDEFTALVSATFDTSSPHLDLDGAPSPFSVFEDDDDGENLASTSTSPRQLRPRPSAFNILRKVKSRATNLVQGNLTPALPRSHSTDLLSPSGTPLLSVPPLRPATSFSTHRRGRRPRSQSIPSVLATFSQPLRPSRPSLESRTFLDEDFYASADTTLRPSTSGSHIGHDMQLFFVRPHTPAGSPRSQGRTSDSRSDCIGSPQSSPGKRSIASKLRNLSRGKRASPIISSSATFVPGMSPPNAPYTPTSDFFPTPTLTYSPVTASPTDTTTPRSPQYHFSYVPSVSDDDRDDRAEALDVDRVLTPEDDPFRRDSDVYVLPSDPCYSHQESPSRKGPSSLRSKASKRTGDATRLDRLRRLEIGAHWPLHGPSSSNGQARAGKKPISRSRSSPMLSSPETFDMSVFPSPPDCDSVQNLMPYHAAGYGPVLLPQPRQPSATTPFMDPGSSRSSTTLMGRDSVTPTPMSSHHSILQPTPCPSMSSRSSSSNVITFPSPPDSVNGRRSPGESVNSLTLRVATPLSLMPPARPPPNKPLPSLPPRVPASSVVKKKSSKSLIPPSAMKHGGESDKPKGMGAGLRVRVDSLGKRFKRDDRVLMAPPREEPIPQVPFLRRELWKDWTSIGGKFSAEKRMPKGIVPDTPVVPTATGGYVLSSAGRDSEGILASQSEKARKTISVGSYATTDTRVSVVSSESGAGSSSTSATSLSVAPESICHSSCRPESLSQATLVTVSSPVTSSSGLSTFPRLSRPPTLAHQYKFPSQVRGAGSRRESEAEDDSESYYSAPSRPLSQLGFSVGHPVTPSEVYLVRGPVRSVWSGQTRTIKLREGETLLVKANGWGDLRHLSDERGSVVVVTEGFGDDWDITKIEVDVVSSAESGTDDSVEVSVRLSSLGTTMHPPPSPRSGLREDVWYAGLPHVPSISPFPINETGLLGVRSLTDSQSSADRGSEDVEVVDSSEERVDRKSEREGGKRRVGFQMEVPVRLSDMLRKVEGAVFGDVRRSCDVVEKSGWYD